VLDIYSFQFAKVVEVLDWDCFVDLFARVLCLCLQKKSTYTLFILYLWFLTNSILEELCRVLHLKSKFEFVIIKICWLLLFC
jgi:hypothetical protein